MKKILLLTAATMMLFACKSNQNEPEQPQQEPMTQKQAMQTYFGSPVALNGTFVETSNAILYATESQSASTPARAKSEGENKDGIVPNSVKPVNS